MSSQLDIFLVGVTGYIGGTVLQRLLDHKDRAKFSLTALVRSREKAAKLENFGVKTVIGSLADLSLLEELSATADVVFAMADCDDLPAAQAILRGNKKYHETTGRAPILIHTSGTGVLADSAAGDYSTDVVYDDSDPDQIETLAITQQHRWVDIPIAEADKAGYVKTYIILPSTIYGIASGPLVAQGIQNPYSVQVPEIIVASLGRGRGGTVGQGKNLWPDVHIEDLGDLYITIFDRATLHPDNTPHGREGFYFGENGEHSLYEVGKAVAEELVHLGRSKDLEPAPFTQAEVDKYFRGSTFWGTNSRCVANRSRSIGWKPTRTKEDLLRSVVPEIQAILNKHVTV